MRIMRFLDLNGHTLVGEDQGDGTAMVVYDAAGVLGPKQDTEAARTLLAGRHAVVADDDAGMRQTMAAILERFDCSCTCCSDGGEALRTITDGRFDFVVSDIAMPEHDGYDVFAAAKEMDPDLPVVLVTGFGYDPGHAIVRASSEGVEAVLYKPFTPQQFVTTLTGALQPGDGAIGIVRTQQNVSVGVPLPAVAPGVILTVQRARVTAADQSPRDDAALRMLPACSIAAATARIELPDAASPRSLSLRPGLGILLRRAITKVTTADEINDHIFGYTACLQLAAKGQSGESADWLGGTAFDSSCPIGPAVITTDSLPDPAALAAHITIDDRPQPPIPIGVPAGSISTLLRRLAQRITVDIGTMIIIRADDELDEPVSSSPSSITMSTDPIGVIAITLDS